MTAFVAIVIGTVLANNAVLTHLLGVDPAVRVAGRLREPTIVAIATGCVLLAATIIYWAIDQFVLTPLRIEWLQALIGLLVVTALAPLPRFFLRGRFIDASAARSLSPVLLISNGLMLGAIALSFATNGGFAAMLARTFGIATGFGILLILFTAMRDRLDGADVPAPFRGAPILLITVAIMALGFMGFAGFGR